jgi:hypothetical protein
MTGALGSSISGKDADKNRPNSVLEKLTLALDLDRVAC